MPNNTLRIYYTRLLAIYVCHSQWFSCIIAMGLLVSIMSFNLCGRTFVHLHAQLSCVYLVST